MPADALNYLYAAKELNGLLSGARIDKITMPIKDTVVLSLRSGTQNRSLFISANPSNPRCHLTKRSFENPLSAPSFLMHLRKHIGGGRIESVTQMPFERVINIKILKNSELKTVCEKTLVLEVMGKYSNIILVNSDGTVSDSIRRISPDVSSKRTVLPGIKLAPPPPQDKAVCKDENTLLAVLDGFTGGSLKNYIQKNVSGLAPASIKEAVFLTFGSTDKNEISSEDKQRIAKNLMSLYDEKTLSPCVAFADGKPLDFFFRPYLSERGEIKHFDSVNDAMECFYAETDSEKNLGEKKKKLLSALKAATAKAEKRLETLMQKNAESKNPEKDKLFGELITANIYLLKKGAERLNAVNYYSENGETVDIPLDKNLTPQANAQRYYKLYAKKKKTLEYNAVQIEKTESELDYLESILLSVELATDDKELEPIAAETENAGLIAPNPKRKNKQKQPTHEISANEFTVDGYKILVGKNNLQNDRITKSAKPFDLWLHTKDVHGSHVIIENGSEDFPPDNVLLTAAAYAAYFSKAREADKVAVDYTFAKNVSKPKNSPPGKVIYVNQYTVFVTPKKPL